MVVQTTPIVTQTEDNACQASFADSESSAAEDTYDHQPSLTKPNMKDCGIQTSKIHFRKITESDSFISQMQDKQFSTDFSLSSIYDDIQFDKTGKKSSKKATPALPTLQHL